MWVDLSRLDPEPVGPSRDITVRNESSSTHAPFSMADTGTKRSLSTTILVAKTTH